MVPSVRHFESLTLWIQLRPGLRDRAWKVTNGHSRKLTKLSMTIFSKFWSRDCYPRIVILSVFMAPGRIVLPAARNKSHRKLLTCFSWRAALGLSFREHKRRNCQIVRSALKTLFYQPWIQTALFLIIAIAAASAAVSWAICWVDLPTSADHFDFNRLYSTAVNKVRSLQCGQIENEPKHIHRRPHRYNAVTAITRSISWTPKNAL